MDLFSIGQKFDAQQIMGRGKRELLLLIARDFFLLYTDIKNLADTFAGDDILRPDGGSISFAQIESALDNKRTVASYSLLERFGLYRLQDLKAADYPAFLAAAAQLPDREPVASQEVTQ